MQFRILAKQASAYGSFYIKVSRERASEGIPEGNQQDSSDTNQIWLLLTSELAVSLGIVEVVFWPMMYCGTHWEKEPLRAQFVRTNKIQKTFKQKK